MAVMNNNLDELKVIAEEIADINGLLLETYDQKEPTEILEIMTALKSYLARTTELYAKAEYLLNIERGIESQNIDPKTSATIYRDIINSRTAQYQKVFRFVERTNASIVHILDVLRSQLSYHKADMTANNYGGKEAK